MASERAIQGGCKVFLAACSTLADAPVLVFIEINHNFQYIGTQEADGTGIMATITQTITETLSLLPKEIKLRRPQKKPEIPVLPKPDQPTCPLDCPCRQQSFYNKYMPIVFQALGIIIAIIATYFIVATDSKLYLFFWVFYSVLRRMMAKSKAKSKAD